METVKKKITANYWAEKLNDCELFDQEVYDSFSIESTIINKDVFAYFSNITSGNQIVEFTVFISIYMALCQRYFEDTQLIFSEGIISEKDLPLLFELDTIKKKTLKQYLNSIKEEVQEVYKYADYRNLNTKTKGFEHYTFYSFAYNKKATNKSFPFQLEINKLENKNYEILISFSNHFVNKNIVVHFLENFTNWVKKMEVYLTKFVEHIPILSSEDRKIVLDKYNDTYEDFDSNQTIISLFEKQVSLIPDQTAIIFGDKKISYQLLDQKSNKLAHYLLKNYKVNAEDLIAVKLERSEWLVVSLLAILKLGAAYVPIDVDYPEDRITYIENDSNAKLVIDQVFLDQFKKGQEVLSIQRINNEYKADNLAYIIYTSGTTGNPKGVMITNSNAVALINWSQREFDLSLFKVVYAATSHCFDLSVFEMFYTLSVGKTMRILNSGLEIASYLDKDEAILLNTVPSTIRKIIEDGCDLNNVTVLNLAGEPFPLDIANKLSKTSIEVRNLYGPSEDTTYSTYYKLKNDVYVGSVPIGKPISNTRAYILDDNLKLLPIGITGKLYLSGTGVTNGYLNRPDLTSEKYIDNPYEEGSKMYDTGDLARWMVSGNIEFLGRKDEQVKLRGYRIELGEIENKISEFSEDIQQAVVVVKNYKGEDVLVAYYTENKVINKSNLRAYLAENIPSYMVPNHFVKLVNIPLTPNGKVNKKALPDVGLSDLVKETYVAPRNHIQDELVSIWEEIIGIQNIGIKDNFFELGGHSLMISQMFNTVHKVMNKSIPFKVFYSNPTIESLSKLLKDDVFEAIQKVPVSSSYMVTPSQHRLWLLSQIEESNQAYHITGALSLEGNVVVEDFSKAFTYVINRHEILRTYFVNGEDGILQQYIVPESDFNYTLALEDFSQLKTPNRAVEQYISEQQNKNKDLSKAPLFKASLLKTGERNFIFFLSMHHIISDGWSLEVLTSEIIEIYRQLQLRQSISLPNLPIQFKDYAFWLAEENNKSTQQAKEYWLNVFQGDLPVIELPSYTNRPLIKTYAGKELNHLYSDKILSRLQVFSQKHQVTLFMTLMTAVKTLLFRYSNQKDIIVGTPVAGREHPDLESQIGLYLNTLAIRTQIEGRDSFLDLLQKEQQQLLDAYSYQEYPFDQLVSQLNLNRDPSRSPLFDIMVVLQNQHQLSDFENRKDLTGITVNEFKIERQTSQFDLSFAFIEKGNDLSLDLSYNTDIYEEHFIRGIFSHLENIINQILISPDVELENIDLLAIKEKQVIQENFNDTKVDFNERETIIDLFNKQVSDTPDNTAIVYNDKDISYSALDKKSNQLAHYLLQNNVINPEDLIAVKLERSEWLIISLLAVLKTGAAYVPVDKEYPENRVRYIIEDTNANIIIDENFLSKFFAEKSLPTHLPEVKISSNYLAYVIYTSGSTGKPKGVMIEHRSLVNLCLWHKDTYSVNASSKGTLFSGIAFDASVWEIYPYLLSGASLYPINDDVIRLDTNRLASYLRDQEITHAYLPSKICQNLIEQNITNLNTTILTGGEALTYSKTTNLQIYNNYGPTENTVVTSFYNCKNVAKESIPIGRPINNTKAYVLSENFKIQPIGVVGELCISGEGLSRGYLGRPELTQEKFVKHPFNEGELLYKTGDLARWLPDGNLEFIGRKDQQVKIRGHRIELGEIEYAIIGYSEDINQAVVLLDQVNQEKVLVAYYVASKSIDKNELKEYLISQLPVYMIPGYFLELEAIPLTANGKIDKEKLPKVVKHDIIRKEYVPPTNKVETKVVEIWKELLQVKSVGITDDFFELGGHSLLLNKLVNEYHKTFGKELNLKEIYSKTSLLDHTKLLTETTASDIQEIKKIGKQEYYELSPSQVRFWLLYKMYGKSKEFNIYSKLPLPKNLNVDVFEFAFNELLKRHETLRTIFLDDKETPKQKILSYVPIKLPYFEKNIISEVQKEIYNHEFELDTFPLFKIALVKHGNDFKLFFNMHHIISDGWSVGVIYQELMEIYKAKLSDRTPNIPSIEIHYKDYSYWINNLLSGNSAIRSQLSYWKEKLSGEIPYLKLPADYSNKVKNSKTKSAYYTVYLQNELKLKISELAAKHKCSVFAVFVATLKILLSRLTSEKDIVIGIPAANRNHYQLKNMVGCFLNTLMLRDTIEGNSSFQDFLLNVNHTLMGGLANQNYPFEYLLQELNTPKDQNRFPLSSIFLNMLDFEAKSTEVINSFDALNGDLEASPKFDFECYLKSYSNGHEINCVYNSELFKKETIQYWIEEYVSIINQAVNTTSISINEFKVFEKYLYQEEDPTPTNAFDTFEETEIYQSITTRFEKQVSKFPDQVAITCKGKEITYDNLNNRANYFGSILVRETQTIGQRIALLLQHDEDSVIGMLSVLKAGHTYVPIDSTSPLNRIQFIIEDSGCNILICSTKTLDKAEQFKQSIPDLKILVIPDNEISTEVSNLGINIDPLSEAYILYTSGSTGTPKGVIQNHKNVLHFIRVYTNNIHISNSDILSVFSTYTFDASVKDIYGSLLNGATLGIYDIAEQGLSNLSHWLKSQNVSIIHMVPTIYRYFLKELQEDEVLESIRIVDLGGEACYVYDFELFKKHFSKNSFLVNDYGPTESTIVLQKFLTHDSQLTKNNVPLGRPVVDTEVYILDEENNKLGVYQEGEIVFRSEYLSLGYLNQKELTEKVFISDPIQPNGRIYKSGDIGRTLPTGEIEYLGRKDSQIKLNGLRIELSEIESQLEKMEAINKAIVVVQEIKEKKYLTAYINRNDLIEIKDVKTKLKNSLPKYMIPSLYYFVESFPLTRTGKIDRKELKSMISDKVQEVMYVAPKNDTEKQLVKIWSEVVNGEKDKIGVNDNFFDLGGHSLNAIQMRLKIQKAFHVKLDLETIFSNPTVKEISGLLKNQAEKQYDEIPLLDHKKFYDLSHAQMRIWVASQFEGGNQAYNIPSIYCFEGNIEIKILEKAFNTLIEHHESLRTAFVEVENTPKQQIISKDEFTFEIKQISYCGKLDVDDLIRDFLMKEAKEGFDLEKAPLLRATLIQIAEKKYALIFNIHHIISDGWSRGVFFSQLIELYKNYKTGIKAIKEPALIQYKEYAAWHSKTFELQQNFWDDLYTEDVPKLNFPTDFSRPKILSFSEATINENISIELFESLQLKSKSLGITLNNLMLSLYAVLISKYSSQEQIIIGSLVSGRNHLDTEKLLGVFINFLPMKLKVNKNQQLISYLKESNQVLIKAYNNQDYPFDLMVDRFIKERDLSRNPFFDTLINFHWEEDINSIKEGMNMDALDISIVDHNYHLKDLGNSGLDFKLDIRPDKEGGLELYLNYNNNLFTQRTMDLFLKRFVQLLQEFNADYNRNIMEYLENIEENSIAIKDENSFSVNLCSSFVLEPMEEILTYWDNEFDMNLELNFTPYNQVFQQLLDPKSILHTNDGVNVLFVRVEDWLRDLQELSVKEKLTFLEKTYEEFITAFKTSRDYVFMPYILGIVPLSTALEEDQKVFDKINEINYRLIGFFSKSTSCYLLSINEAVSLYEVSELFDLKSDSVGHMPFSQDAYAAIATLLCRKIRTLKDDPYKVIAVDCDNTIWGGICGEDGVDGLLIDENYQAVQQFLVKKQEEGFLIVLCSKNNEQDVWEVLETRKEMKLRPKHIVGHKINWDLKSKNIIQLSKELNVGIDSFIFIDDSMFEIEQMMTNCPEVLSLLMPENKEDFEGFLKNNWAFDRLYVTEEDAQRSDMYKAEQERNKAKLNEGALIDDFIKSLNISVLIEDLTEQNIERAAQLTRRTNQFNANGIRRSEGELLSQYKKETTLNWTIKVSDKFGDYGLVGVMLGEVKNKILYINTFLLSCRVLGRNVENVIKEKVESYCLEINVDSIVLNYKETPKNKPFKEFVSNTIEWQIES